MRGIVAEIDTRALSYNFRLLVHHAGRASVMAVVKADAYGHGLTLVVPTLVAEGCGCFAVTDSYEGKILRLLLQSLGATGNIILLAGIADAEDACLCNQYHLFPVIFKSSQVHILAQHHFTATVWIKIDTGMARIGAEDPYALWQKCQQHGLHVTGILSHLACADTPEQPLNALQVQRFQRWQKRMPASLQASLLNTAGLFTMPQQVCDVVRPGIGLYGIEPCINRVFGLQPVMHLSATVVHVRSLKKGDSVGYGASFVAPTAMRIGIVDAGYGDGISRSLSNRGSVYSEAYCCPILGRVCMDYCMVDLSNTNINEGQQVFFWNEQHSVATVADDLGTIAYELLTRVGSRVPRKKKTI